MVVSKNILIFLLVGLMTIASASAVDFIVDAAGNGDFSTIQACANAAQAGDVCLIRAGMYTERVGVYNPGVSFVGETHRTATIDGSIDIFVPDVRIEALSFTTSEHIYPAPIMLWEGSDNAKIYDNYLFNIDAHGAIHSPFGRTVTPSNVHVKGNLLYHVQGGIYVVGDNWLVEDNEIDTLFKYNAGDCDYVRFHGSGHIFRNNYFHGTIETEIHGAHVDCYQTWDQNNPHFIENITIDNNLCFGFHTFVIAGREDVRNITVTNNIAANFYEWGFDQGVRPIDAYDIPDMLIEHNTFYGWVQVGINMADRLGGTHPSGVIKNNLLGGDAIRDTGAGHGTEGCRGECDVGYNMIWNYGYQACKPCYPTTILDSTEFVNPVVTNDRSQWMPLNPVACTGGEGGTHIGAVPCGAVSYHPADLNQDGCIDLGEISAFVGLWLNGEVDLGQVSDAVSLWLQGC